MCSTAAGSRRRIAALFCSRRSEEHTSELQSRPHLVCRLLLVKKKPLLSEFFICIVGLDTFRYLPAELLDQQSSLFISKYSSNTSTSLFFLSSGRPPRPTLFPYTSLFR